MNESNSIETTDKTKLTEQTKFRLSEIIGIENYFYQEINQRKSCSKKLSKYVSAFDQVSIISFTGIVGAPIGISSVSFTLLFSLTAGIVKKLLNITRSKKKKHDKFLCWLKVNSIALKL